MSDSSAEFSTPDIVDEEIIRLLEERLIVERSKRKVGEVVVRKVIETRTVEVPVRRETLIVEQISPEPRQLVEIELGQGEITGVELAQVTRSDDRPTVKGEFTSLKAASSLMNVIAQQQHHGCKKVRVELILEDSEHQATYQSWFDRCTDTPRQHT